MATVERFSPQMEESPARPADQEKQKLNRLAEVRRQQGLSPRSVMRQMGIDSRTMREEEDPTADLKLSDLYRWQKVLRVPVADLLVESSEPLSRPVMERARLVRIMKTAKAIAESSESTGVTRLAQMLTLQLTEIMPELEEVGPWHSVGQRRSLDEFGRAAERLFREDSMGRSH